MKNIIICASKYLLKYYNMRTLSTLLFSRKLGIKKIHALIFLYICVNFLHAVIKKNCVNAETNSIKICIIMHNFNMFWVALL